MVNLTESHEDLPPPAARRWLRWVGRIVNVTHVPEERPAPERTVVIMDINAYRFARANRKPTLPHDAA